MASAVSTPRKTLPQGGGFSRKKYSAAVRNPPGHKTNAEMEADMVRTDVDPAVLVKFVLLKDLQPVEVGQLITSYGFPVQSIKTMFALETGRITVQMTSQQYAEDLKTKHRNNLNNGQASLRLIEAEETKFVSVSRVFGDFSDEKVKRLVFGDLASKVVSVHYERLKTANGELLWFTGRRFYNFLKVDHDELPELAPFVELDKGHRSWVRVQGRKRQCLRCKSEGHLIADCPEEDEREKIQEESDEEGDDESDKEESSEEEKEKDPPFAVSQDISNISEGTEDFVEVPEASNNIVTQSNTSNPAWATQSFYSKKRKFPTSNVNVPGHWKAHCQGNPKVKKEVRTYLENRTELTPEFIRALCKQKHDETQINIGMMMSPNLKLLTDDPNAAEFDWDAIFLPPDSFLSNNTI